MSLAALALAAVTVAFPAERQNLPNVEVTYVIGAVEKGFAGPVVFTPVTNADDVASLATPSFGAVTAEVHRTGAFIAMMPAAAGTNRFTVTAGDESLVRTFRVSFPPPPPDPNAPPPKPHDPYVDLGISTNETFAPKPPKDRPRGEITVMLDAGHGKNDTGAISPHGWPEKDVNLLQVLELDKAFRKAGFKTILTRSDDSFPALYDRPKMACREKVDAFISIHHNATHASQDPRKSRHTVAYASNTNGLELAAAIQPYVASVMAPVRNIGAQLRSYAVCRNPVIPSCLLEIDFINLPDGEADTWEDEGRRKKVADAIVLGFLDWLGR